MVAVKLYLEGIVRYVELRFHPEILEVHLRWLQVVHLHPAVNVYPKVELHHPMRVVVWYHPLNQLVIQGSRVAVDAEVRGEVRILFELERQLPHPLQLLEGEVPSVGFSDPVLDRYPGVSFSPPVATHRISVPERFPLPLRYLRREDQRMLEVVQLRLRKGSGP